MELIVLIANFGLIILVMKLVIGVKSGYTSEDSSVKRLTGQR